MPLSDLQDKFAAAVLDPTRAIPKGVTSYSSPQPLRRFNVYRNNVVASLIQVLEARYPAVRRLVGEEFFRAMARLHLDSETPRSPVLIEYGGGMPDFIERFEPASDTPYLADVAHLEWLQHEAYHAADAAPLAAEDLGKIEPDALAGLRLVLHPSLRLLTSRFPVLAIWETNIRDAEVKQISLAAGGDELMVLRPRLEVQIVRLPPGALPFVAAIQGGAGLAAAARMAHAADPRFDFQHALAGLIQSEAIVGYQLAATDSGQPGEG